MKWAAGLCLWIACGLSATAGPAEEITNRLARLLTGSNYTFTIQFGLQGALRLEGYQQGTNCAFTATLADREVFRHADGWIWFPSCGTGGAVVVRVPYSFHIVTGYNGVRNATLGISVMPPTRRPPMILQNYGGLAIRMAELAEIPGLAAGWRFADTNQTGTCLEFGPRDTDTRVMISLQKEDERQNGIVLHEVTVAQGRPERAVDLPPATRRVEVTDFGVSLTFLRNISVSTLNAAAASGGLGELFTAYGSHIDLAAKGLEGVFPSLPPGLRKLPALPATPPAAPGR